MALSKGADLGSLTQLSGIGRHNKGLEEEQHGMSEGKSARRNKDATSKVSSNNQELL